MLRASRGVAARIVAGAMLLGGTGQAAAQTTTTTVVPTTTTSTTTAPPPTTTTTTAAPTTTTTTTAALTTTTTPPITTTTRTTTTTRATTTTTPPTTTTSTTLLPHPYSAATAACVHGARAELRACRRTGGSDCFTAFETAFANCFASGAGVSCAKKCVTNEGTCFTKLPATKASCRKACITASKADVRACRRIADGDNIWAGGDASCLSTAQANLDLCRAVCAGLGVDCQTTLKFCIANCPNL